MRIKLNWQQKLFLSCIGIIIVFFPNTNAYLALGIDILLTQMALVGYYFYIPAAIIATIIGIYKVFVPEKVNIPKKNKKKVVKDTDYIDS